MLSTHICTFYVDVSLMNCKSAIYTATNKAREVLMQYVASDITMQLRFHGDLFKTENTGDVVPTPGVLGQ